MPDNNKIEFEQITVNYPALPEPFRDRDSVLIKRLFREVDDSNFTLPDWLESLATLYQWLDDRQLSLAPEDAVGYVSCTAKSVGNSALLNHLPSLLLDFLEQYGCELAIKK